MKELLVVFITIFIAEIGDKTQVAALLYSTNEKLNPIGVFSAASLALICSTFLAVFFGSQITHYISPEKIKWIAGIGFITIGIWTLIDTRL
ncbi:MAG: TMEM165/GDT1 family protein [Desulfobacterales bacterium]